MGNRYSKPGCYNKVSNFCSAQGDGDDYCQTCVANMFAKNSFSSPDGKHTPRGNCSFTSSFADDNYSDYSIL